MRSSTSTDQWSLIAVIRKYGMKEEILQLRMVTSFLAKQTLCEYIRTEA